MQGIPQPPQFAASVLMSMQRPLQIWLRQTWHTLFTQVSVAPQTLPQAPQFRLSSGAFTHRPPQLNVGIAQPVHMPFVQAWPGAHG
jgi:hypothetical protein